MISLIAGRQRARAGVLLRAVVAMLLGGFLVLAGAQSASAHAELLSTTPQDGAALEQAPAEAVLTFNEPVQLIEGSVRLFPGDADPLVLDARVVDAAIAAPFPDDLADGRYALSYRVVSADGHPISGAITFTIGDATGSALAPAVDTQTPGDTQRAVSILTAAQYLSLLVFAGLLFFVRVIRRSPRGIDRPTALILRSSGMAAVVASLLLIPVSALNVTGAPLVALFVPATWWPGVLWGPVVAATVVVVGVVGAGMAQRRVGNAAGGAVAVCLGALAVAAPVVVGHSQLIEPRPLMILADLGHLFAGSFWVGAVVGLILLLAAARLDTDGAPGLAVVARTVQRFSRVAVWSVILLAISGALMGTLIVGSIDALVTTGYGLTLLLKISIAVPVIALAAYNRRRLLPSLSTPGAAAAHWRVLRRTLAYEAALLVVILAVTGFLTNLSPRHDHAAGGSESAATTESAGPLTIRGESQNLTVDGVIDPGSVGENDIGFTLRFEGEPVTPASVTLRVSLPEQDFGPFSVTPELNPATGAYAATLDFPLSGEWQVQIIARVSTFAEPIVTVPVTVR